MQNGNICLTQEETKCPLDKYTYSNGMISSVKLGVWEALLDEFIESIEPVTVVSDFEQSLILRVFIRGYLLYICCHLQDLKLGNRIRITRKELLRKTGELYALKHRINLSSDLLDVPDFYWEREELERLYLNTCRYFSVPKRTRVRYSALLDRVEFKTASSAPSRAWARNLRVLMIARRGSCFT